MNSRILDWRIEGLLKTFFRALFRGMGICGRGFGACSYRLRFVRSEERVNIGDGSLSKEYAPL